MRQPMVLEDPRRIVRTPMGRAPLRCVLISGGNAAGKTSLFVWGRARVGSTTPGYVWHSEGGGAGAQGAPKLCTLPADEALELARQEWADPAVHTMVVEGTRVYSTIFRCALAAPTVRRELWTLQLLQTPNVGRAQIRARCAARGKEYRASYWESSEAGALFARRYETAHGKFLPSARRLGLALGEQLAVWVDQGYTALQDTTPASAKAWLARALGVPIVVRTPMRIDRAAEAGGATA